MTTIGAVLRRILPWMLVAVVISNAVVVVKDFSGYIGSYPHLAVDDSLANVSFSLATADRYGFLASPLQAPADAPRHDGFFNYGPWYFYLGAALTWLFGYSLSLLRAIHLGAILLVAVVAFWWFRDRRAPVAAAILGIGILHCFQVAQWPMVRPDVVVSLFAVALAVSVGLAYRSHSGWHWFAAGFAASSGAFTHLIAWSLVPACAVLFFFGEWLQRGPSGSDSGPGRRLRNLGFVIGGGLAGAVLFYASFDFRISDHLATLGAYRSSLGAADPVGTPGPVDRYLETVAEHWRIAYAYLPAPGRALLGGALLGGWLLPLAAIWRRPGPSIPVVAFVLPPTVIWSLYFASLGLYPNFHLGYAILSQVIAFWTCAAVVHATLLLLDERPGRLADFLTVTIGLMAMSSGLLFASRTLSEPTQKAATARQWVNIQAYLDEALASIPAGARAWGTVMYGIETPRRVQLVQFREAARLAERATAESRRSLAPDYVIWGYPENRDGLLESLAGKEGVFHKLETLFPDHRYRLVTLIRAAPYGTARVYQRAPVDHGVLRSACTNDCDGAAPSIPAVAFYHPGTSQWARAALDGDSTVPHPVPAQHLRVGFEAPPRERVADRSVSMDLPAGDYLVRVRLSTNAGERSARVMLATSGAQSAQRINELGPDFDSAPYASTDREVFLAHRHTGGAMVVSQLDKSAGAAIRGVVAYPVEPLRDFRIDRREESLRPLPAWENWVPDRSAGVAASREADAFRVRGNDSPFGYQFVSPPIAVGARKNVIVRLEYAVEQGAVCPGILNEAQTKWIVAATEPRRELRFNSGAAATLRVVFANCNVSAVPGPRTILAVQRAEYSVDDSENTLYTDQLMRSR